MRKQRELDRARANQDVQDRTFKHFEEEKERMEKTLDESKLYVPWSSLIPRHFTQADDVDLSSGVIIPSFDLETKQEEPVEEKLDKTVDFERLLGAKEGEKEGEKAEAREGEKAEAKEGEKAEVIQDIFEGKQSSVEESSEKTSANRSAEAFESKRARLDSGDSANEFVYTQKEQRKENWIRKGLEVKILNEKLANGKWGWRCFVI